MRNLVALSISLLVAAAACTAAPEPPATPTWDEDVYPLLKGSCLHCHGSTALTSAGPTGSVFRFDSCNRMATAFDSVGVKPANDAVQHLRQMLMSVQSQGGARPVMPPAPAHPLTDYEVTVLKNWEKVIDAGGHDAACKKTSGNRKPSASLSKPLAQGAELVVEIDIVDPDGDQVLGKVTTGNNNTAEILSAGHHTLKIRGGTGDRITVKLTDGYDVADLTLP